MTHRNAGRAVLKVRVYREKKILEEDYGLKMSMELEGRMSEMCNVSDYWEEVATEEGKEIGKEIGDKR